jgi:4-alpha-glucanotransferase
MVSEELPDSQKQNFCSYLKCKLGGSDEAAPALIRLAWSSVAGVSDCAVTGSPDLGMGSRMNVPGRADGNWRWRFSEDVMSSPVFEWLRELTESSKRMGPGARTKSVKAESGSVLQERCSHI